VGNEENEQTPNKAMINITNEISDIQKKIPHRGNYGQDH
jgi:hypothetical protein